MTAAADNVGSAFLLLWNPQRFDWDGLPKNSYAWCVRQTALGEAVDFAWRIGHSRQIRRGDRVFLLRTNRQRGIIGAGRAAADVRPVDGVLMLPVTFDLLLPAEDVLPVEVLEREVAGVPWKRQYASGNRLAPPLAAAVERLWRSHVRGPLRKAPRDASATLPAPPSRDAAEMALSVRQPHLEAILRGVKLEEYRSVPTTVRRRIYLYATKARYEPAEERAWLQRYGIADVVADELPRGVLAGTVEIVDCRERRGGFAWTLARPNRLERPRRPTGMPQPMWFRPFG